MTPSAMPILLALDGRRALVVGGGTVATRRVESFVAAGAKLDVVAPDVTQRIRELHDQAALNWMQRRFDDADIAGAWLVCTATGIADIDDRVAQLCAQQRIWCVHASAASRGSATTPAVVYGPDGVSVAVSGGGDPGRAIAIRDAIAVRLDDGSLPLRAHRKRGDPTDPVSRAGRVILVGAGPGDPGLITVRGIQAVARADVLVVDRLAPVALWSRAAEGVEVIEVGKAPGQHSATQDEINQLLVNRAKAGNLVVRLKGGDPFVLGRGGEEVQVCREAGIPVEVVPGITSAIAVPAAAGIPLTQRHVTSSFVVASAHDGPTGVLAATAGAPPDASLVLLMGAGRLSQIAAALIEHGRSPATPVAIIESGWTPQQRTTVSDLEAVAAGHTTFDPPAIVVVGEVVRLRETFGDLGLAAPDAGHALRRDAS